MVAQCLAPLAAGDSVENDGFFDIVNGIDDAESVVSGQFRATARNPANFQRSFGGLEEGPFSRALRAGLIEASFPSGENSFRYGFSRALRAGLIEAGVA